MLDSVYASLGQRVRVYRQRGASSTSDGVAAPEIDLDGNPITPAASPDDDPLGELLGDYPCIAYQLDAQDRAALGALDLPLWEVVVHHSARLDVPGLRMQVRGGELPTPLHLVPLADIEDIGTQGVAWTFVGRAPDATRGA